MVMIETERLTLCRLTTDDADFIHALFNESEFLRFIGDRGIHTQADACNYIVNGPLHSYAQHGFGLLIARLKDNGIAIGTCGLLKRESLENADIGYAFLPKYRGQGFAFEAATAVTNFAKDTLKLQRIVAITAPDNIKSIKLLEKLGFHFDKMIKLSEASGSSKLFVADFS